MISSTRSCDLDLTQFSFRLGLKGPTWMMACSWLSLHVVKMSSRDVGISAFLSGCTETFRIPLQVWKKETGVYLLRKKEHLHEGYQGLVIMHPDRVTDGNFCIRCFRSAVNLNSSSLKKAVLGKVGLRHLSDLDNNGLSGP
jgi:hypothetical protein